jgi:hypothetical protein
MTTMLKRNEPPAPKVDSFTPERIARERAELDAELAERLAKAGIKPPPPPAAPAAPDAGTLLSRRGRAPDPLAGLPSLGHVGPVRPTPAAVEPYDAELAALLAAAVEAGNDARAAATDAAAAQPGGALWAAAVQAEAIEVSVTLDRGEEWPESSPLFAHLTDVAPHLIVHAHRAQAASDWADRRANDRALAIAAELSGRCDEIEAQIGVIWLKAQVSKDRADHSAGMKLARQWSEARAVWVWCCQPDRPYVGPRYGMPGGLEYAEYQADIATGGKERMMPPVPPASAAALEREFGR